MKAQPRSKKPKPSTPETTSEEEEINLQDLGRSYRSGGCSGPTGGCSGPRIRSPRSKNNYTKEENDYLKTLSNEERTRLIEQDKQISAIHPKIPLRFKILSSNLPHSLQSLLIARAQELQEMNEDHSEYFKLKRWMDHVFLLPLNMYRSTPLPSGKEQIQAYLKNIHSGLDQRIYGHNHCKHEFLKMVAQWISNPKATGHAIGLEGPPGVGKTSFVQEGIANVLGLPVVFISLGGSHHGSYLNGHALTFEGSIYGQIAQGLIQSQCMNPIFFFDELDKVSDTPHGDEIMGVLTHLVDPSQNRHFMDHYFQGIELDVSRAIFIFSYNDGSKIHPILKNRLSVLTMKGYSNNDKLILMDNYLLPKMYQDYGIRREECNLSIDLMDRLLKETPLEPGIRLFKQAVESYLSEWNLNRYLID